MTFLYESRSEYISADVLKQSEENLLASTTYATYKSAIEATSETITIIVVDGVIPLAGCNELTAGRYDPDANTVYISTTAVKQNYYMDATSNAFPTTMERIIAHEVTHAWQDITQQHYNASDPNSVLLINSNHAEGGDSRSAYDSANTIMDEYAGETAQALVYDSVHDTYNGAVTHYILPEPVYAYDGSGTLTSHTMISRAVGDAADTVDTLVNNLINHPRFADPLTIDMDKNNQVDLQSINEGRVFDVDSDGFDEHVGWVKPQDGILCRDLDSDGSITDQSELFGNPTTSGFDALALLDSNSDGVINSSDTGFTSLLVWQDANQDGIGQSTELQSLSAAGIVSIDLSTTTTNYLVGGNSITKEGTVTWSDSSTSKAYDVNLSINEFLSRYNEEYDLSSDALTVPTLRGYGTLADLHIAMSTDTSLFAKVEDFTEMSLSNYREVQNAVIDILTDWANADEQGVHPYYDSNGGSLSSSQAFFMDAFLGASSSYTAVGSKAGLMFDRVVQMYGNRLLMDSFFKSATPDLSYNIYQDKYVGTVTWADLIDKMAEFTPTEFDQQVLYWRDMAALLTEISSNLGSSTSAFETLLNSELSGEGLGFSYTDLSVMNNQSSLAVGNGLVSFSDPITGQFVALAEQSSHYNTSTSSYDYSYTSGNDIIIGLTGGVDGTQHTGATLSGGDGNDSIYATYLNDTIHGNSDDDTIYGYQGDDKLYGDNGNDAIYGNEGADTIEGGDGNDILYGGDGNDIITGGDGIDYIYGGDGNDTITGGIGKDVIHGDGGDDTITDTDDDAIYGDAGNDVITGGGDGIQTIYGGDGNDTISFDSSTVLNSLTSFKYTYGGEGNDTLAITRGANFLDGGTGDDTFSWDVVQGGNTVYPNGVYITDSSGNDTLSITDAQSAVTMEKSGNDLLVYYNNYTITVQDEFLDPAHLVIDTVQVSSYSGTSFDALIDMYSWTPVTGSTYTGTSGGNSLAGTNYSDTIYGLGGNDTLNGFNGNDYLDGGTGDDNIVGGGQSDTLIGGTGNDTLNGGNGNDTYVFQTGDGQDTITGETTTESFADKILFTDATTLDDLNFDYASYNLNVYYGASDKISMAFFSVAGEGYATAVSARVESIEFNDTSSYDIADNVKLYTSYSSINQTFSDGVDIVFGYTSADTINLAAGNDTAHGNSGADIINGGDGNDWLYGDAGNDTLDGGDGNDRLQGGADNDTYVASAGYDIITETSGTDQINFGSGIGIGDLEIYRMLTPTQDLYINWGDANQIRIVNGFSASTAVEQILFSDMSTYTFSGHDFVTKGTENIDTIYGLALAGYGTNDTIYGYGGNDNLNGGDGNDTIYGGDGNDTINGNNNDDTIYGDAGDDTLNGNDGNDTIYGGDGIDTIHAGNNNDTVYGDAGNDYLYGDYGFNILHGGDGNDSITAGNGGGELYGDNGNDTLTGGYGNDTLSGGSGDDYMSGSTGNDLFIYQSGIDTMNDSGGTDVLHIANGITVSDIIVSTVGYNAKIVVDSGVDELTITNEHLNSSWAVERIEFDDGFSTTLADHAQWMIASSSGSTITGTTAHSTIIGLEGNDTLDGSDGNDDVYGGAGNDIVKGGNGDDLVHGGIGDDTIYGNDGTDTLYGGAGADTFVFESTSAFNNVDTIKDFNTSDGDAIDISDLLTGYTPGTSDIADFVTLGTSGSDTKVSVDADGAGTTYSAVQVATINYVTGLDVHDMLTNGNLIAA